MLFALNVVVVLLFPAAAVWAWRSGGVRRLGVVTSIALIVLVTGALAAASPWFGNRLAGIDGFSRTAFRTLLLFGLTAGLPLVGAALIAGGVGTVVTRPLASYIAAMVTALVLWVVGTLLAVSVFFR